MFDLWSWSRLCPPGKTLAAYATSNSIVTSSQWLQWNTLDATEIALHIQASIGSVVTDHATTALKQAVQVAIPELAAYQAHSLYRLLSRNHPGMRSSLLPCRSDYLERWSPEESGSEMELDEADASSASDTDSPITLSAIKIRQVASQTPAR